MNPALSAAVSFLIGIGGGFVGSYIGIKIGLVRLQVWKEWANDQIKENSKQIMLNSDDLLAHDFEIDAVMQTLKLTRFRRQTTSR